MIESFSVFAAAVLAAHAAGRENWLATLGAELFLFGRLACAALYIAGVPYVRTVAWTVAITGVLLVLRAPVLN